MKKKKSPEAAQRTAPRLMKALAVGTGSGVVVWTLLLFCAAWLLAGTSEPESFVMPAVFTLAAVSSFTAACVTSKFSGMKSLFPGLITGAVLLFAVWAISLACAGSKGEVSVILKLLLCIDFLVFSLIGGKIAMPNTRKRKKGRK